MEVGERKILDTFLEGKLEKLLVLIPFFFMKCKMLQALAIEASFLPI